MFTKPFKTHHKLAGALAFGLLCAYACADDFVAIGRQIYRDPVFVLGMGRLDVHLHVPLFIFGASG